MTPKRNIRKNPKKIKPPKTPFLSLDVAPPVRIYDSTLHRYPASLDLDQQIFNLKNLYLLREGEDELVKAGAYKFALKSNHILTTNERRKEREDILVALLKTVGVPESTVNEIDFFTEVGKVIITTDTQTS